MGQQQRKLCRWQIKTISAIRGLFTVERVCVSGWWYCVFAMLFFFRLCCCSSSSDHIKQMREAADHWSHIGTILIYAVPSCLHCQWRTEHGMCHCLIYMISLLLSIGRKVKRNHISISSEPTTAVDNKIQNAQKPMPFCRLITCWKPIVKIYRPNSYK